MMKSIKKRTLQMIAGGTALCAVAALLLAGMSGPMEVETVTLAPEDAAVTFTEQGAYQYRELVDVHPLLTGQVEKIAVKEGDRVKAGDPLAVVAADNVDYQIQRLEADIQGYNAQIYGLSLSEQKERDSLLGSREELQGQLTSLESEMRSQQQSEETRESQIRLQEQIVDQERDNVRLARQNLRDYRDDYGSDTSDPEYVQMKQSLIDAEKGLSSSEQRLLELQNAGPDAGYYEGQKESIQARMSSIDNQVSKNYSGGSQSYYYAMIQSAQVSIEELRQQQGEATVTSPCDGVVQSVPARSSNTVDQGTVIATVGRDPVVEVYVPVREMDGIRVGDPVVLTVPKRAADTVSAGKVTAIDSQAEVRLSPLGVEEARVRVEIRTDDPTIKVGYQVDATFTVYRQEDCLTVPKKAVFTLDGQDAVWVIRDGLAAIQPVAKGVEVRGGVIIDEGLLPGDEVVADANTQGLEAGKKLAGIAAA